MYRLFLIFPHIRFHSCLPQRVILTSHFKLAVESMSQQLWNPLKMFTLNFTRTRSPLKKIWLLPHLLSVMEVQGCACACVWRTSLVPRPHLLMRKRIRWLLVVPSQPSWFLNTYLYDVALFNWLESTLVWHGAISLACSEPILLTWHNQESVQWSPDPFPHERVESGHETSKRLEE